MEFKPEDKGLRPAINYNSPEWAVVEEWLSTELLELYRRIAQPQMDERDTQFYRGRASMLESMLEFRNMNDAFGPH